jgi:formylglycine-generating enzyme required for sulfatase activity
VDYDQYSAIAQGAHCTFSVACPPDGGTFCRDNVVYGCDGGDSTVQLRDCGTGVCVERNGQGMCASSTTAPVMRFVPIPGGTFRATWDEPEVTFGDFEMLEREVTWSEYGACVAAGACAPPSSECTLVDYQRSDLHADLPVTCIDLPQARAFCATLGARVPTTDEWRYALSNASAEYQFPCAPGDVPCEDTIRRSLSRPCGVDEPMVGCAVGDDVSTQGVCDLLGNVTELVEHTPGSGVPARCGVGPGCGDARIDLLGPHQIGTLMPLWSVGFRCVR